MFRKLFAPIIFAIFTMNIGCGSTSQPVLSVSDEQLNFNNAVTQLKNGAFDDAATTVFSDVSQYEMDSGLSPTTQIEKDELSLYYYAMAKENQADMKSDMAVYYLKNVQPIAGVVTKAQLADLNATLQKQVDQAAADQAKANSPEERKKHGVEIGMTEDEVLMSSWGKPEHINKTTTSSGTSEQWVYGHSYLYFDNGILTTIQN